MASPVLSPQLTEAPPAIRAEPRKSPRHLQVIRIAIALPLMALSAGALFPLAVIPVSSQAVVNARLSRVLAPARGQAIKVAFEAGDVVAANQEIARVQSLETPPRGDVAESAVAKTGLETQYAALRGDLAAAEERLAHYETLLRDYGTRMADSLELQLREAQRERASANEETRRLEEEVRRDERAQQEHILSALQVAQAQEKAISSKRAVDEQQGTIDRLKTQIVNIRAGFFVGQDGGQPRYLALRDEAANEVGKLRQQKIVLERRLNALTAQIAAVPAPSRDVYAIKSPVSGVIWGRAVAAGQTVNEGEDLYRIADAASVHVDVWLDRRYGPQLSIGDSALIYLSGLGKELSGRVTAFQGTSRRRLDEENSSIDLQPVHPDQYRVTIQLSPKDRDASYIGQAAKVLFPGGKASLKGRLYFWLTRL